MHTYTDKELNGLNKYPNVYSVDPDFAKRKGYSVVVSSPNPNPAPDALKEVNKIKVGKQEFQVIATKSDPKTGFDGMAVAPIVNGQPDYSSVVGSRVHLTNKINDYLVAILM